MGFSRGGLAGAEGDSDLVCETSNETKTHKWVNKMGEESTSQEDERLMGTAG